MSYQDFLLNIKTENNTTVDLYLLDSPMGQWFGKNDIQQKDTLDRLTAKFHNRTISKQEVQILGTLLYETIFPEELERRLIVSKEQDSDGIRLRIWCEGEYLDHMPWEVLYDPVQKIYLALDYRTPVIRHWPEAPHRMVPRLSGKLCGVIAGAGPNDQQPIDIDGESAQIQTELEAFADIQTVIPATQVNFVQALNRDAHFLHFIGHGWYDQENQSGGIVLENENRGSAFVGEDELRAILSGLHVRLIFLGACHSLNSARAAQSILRATGTTVIGNQTKILDSSAVQFSKSVYQTLSDHIPLERAITTARKTILNKDRGEWAVPVLSMGLQVGDFQLLLRSDEIAIDKAATLYLPAEPYYPLQKCESEIGNILAHLDQRRSCFVQGIGGIGKTALAVELARRSFRGTTNPWQKMVWASAKQEMLYEAGTVRVKNAIITYDELLETIAKQLGHPGVTQKSTDQKEELVARLLHKEQVLVLIDNLETLTEAQALVRDFSQILGQSQTVITSRELVDTNFPVLAVTGLEHDDAIRFIYREAAQRNIKAILLAPVEKLSPIYDVTGGNPLAIKLVIGQVRTMDLEWALDMLKTGAASEIYDYIFKASHQLLNEDLLYHIATSPGSLTLQDIKATFADEVLIDLQGALQKLINLSLVLPDVNVSKRYTVHQLTRNFVANTLPEIWAEE